MCPAGDPTSAPAASFKTDAKWFKTDAEWSFAAR